jgi:cytochrome c biogenesis protein
MASPVVAWPSAAIRRRPNPIVLAGEALWDLLTSVNFAVLQISVLAVMAVIGMTIRQLPGRALQQPGVYATEMAKLRDRYDAAFGTAVVDGMERLQVFHIFSSTWFSLGLIVLITSIVVCTIDRTPRLWRQSADIRVVQPEPFFDPRLPDRAATTGISADAVGDVLRRHRFRVRRSEVDGVAFVYGDRHQWTKMATLLTHTGLVLFLIAAAVTSRLGDEQGLALADGEAAPVQPIGTPGLLYVRNVGFHAPRDAKGNFADFTTDLEVYRDGQLLASKTIRVNDPLTVAGYTFHQNGFRPAPDLLIRDKSGATLWAGPVGMFEEPVDSQPRAIMGVPGRDVGLDMILTSYQGETGLLVLPYRTVGVDANGDPIPVPLNPLFVALGASGTNADLDFSVDLRGIAGATLLIAKNDPGQGLVWLAFGSLISGILITFYLPRRRVWTRIAPTGQVAIVGRSDRYVDFEREFSRLLGDLVARRTG